MKMNLLMANFGCIRARFFIRLIFIIAAALVLYVPAGTMCQSMRHESQIFLLNVQIDDSSTQRTSVDSTYLVMTLSKTLGGTSHRQ